MSDDWLWDGTPPEAPEDKALVDALAPLRRDRPLPPLPERAPQKRPRSWWPAFAVVALAAAALAWVFAPGEGWPVRSVAGARPCALGPCRFAAGDLLQPPVGSTWEVQLDDAGTLQLAGGASLLRTPATEGYRLRLDEGELTAAVTAPPGAFVVETPSARVEDLGCAFTVTVTPDRTDLAVHDGSVALRNDAGTSIVTAGSVARVDRGSRPRLPVRADASPELRAAVEDVERAGAPVATDTSLDTLVTLSTPEDLLTLWHVLQVVPRTERPPLLETMERLAPGCAPEADPVLDLQPDALRSLWRYLAPFALGPRPTEIPADGR